MISIMTQCDTWWLIYDSNHVFSSSYSSYPLEWICKVYMEYVTGTLSFQNGEIEDTIETHFNKLLTLSETSTLAKLAKVG